MRNVVVLGSTGSIGTQTLDVIARRPDKFRAVGLAANRNQKLLVEQASQFGVEKIALFDGDGSDGIPHGMESLLELVTLKNVDIVVVAVAGVIGLLPTLRAIEAGRQIALASKEVLVAAGELTMERAKRKGVRITPIDSEHSALFQCLEGYRPDQVDSLILTASGGPFRGCAKARLDDVSVEDALNHPTWRMGGKITVDSASMMNKALELIEAHWLFGVDAKKIEVVVHPQSVVHSMVRFTDGSVLGQMGFPDMRMPIAYALSYPERLETNLPRWSPTANPCLTFEELDETVFPSIALARRALRIGGTMPAILNAANEEAANGFLRGELKFIQIWEVVGRAIAELPIEKASLEAILSADGHARSFARKLMSEAAS
jgi:1-deoxy-D-xylulose-5-phosphate reductoisomerase